MSEENTELSTVESSTSVKTNGVKMHVTVTVVCQGPPEDAENMGVAVKKALAVLLKTDVAE